MNRTFPWRLRPAAWLVLVLLVSGVMTPIRGGEPDPWDLMDTPFAAHFRQRILNLSDPSWEVREGASQWLVQHRESWWQRVPGEWVPEGPEARWRWERVKQLAEDLASLPVTLAEEPLESIQWRARRLHRELGKSYVSALEACLASPTIRTRRRAIEVLAALPDVDVRALILRLEADPAPSVRRVLYQIAEGLDPSWTDALLKRAFRRGEREALVVEIVRAARRQPNPDWRPLLRERWALAGPELRAEIALALSLVASRDDRDVLHWMLGSRRYPIVVAALPALARWANAEDVPGLVAVLESAEPEVRRRLFELIVDRGSADLGWTLLPLVESPDEELAFFAVQTLVRWGASDYIGDLDVLLREHPLRDALWPLVNENAVARPDEAFLVPAPTRLDRGQVIPAIRRGQPRTPRSDHP